jgi:hypothetical protein
MMLDDNQLNPDEVIDNGGEDESAELEAEAPEVEEEAEAGNGEGDDETGEDDGSASLTVTIEGEEPEQDDSHGIRNLRAAFKDQKKKIRELEDQLKAKATPEPALGEKPKLEEFDYDADKFAEALISWNERKRAHEAKQAAAAEEETKVRERFGQRKAVYAERKAAVGARDFDEAEESVIETLSIPQQSVIISHSEQPELIVYALGKNPKVAQKLAASTDLIEFAYELAKLEKSLKVTGTQKPAPEKRLPGGKGVPLSNDKKLAQLEAQAEATGDYSKVHAYKRSLKPKG